MPSSPLPLEYREFRQHTDAKFIRDFEHTVPGNTEYVFKEKVCGHRLTLNVTDSGAVTATSPHYFLGAQIAVQFAEKLRAVHADLSRNAHRTLTLTVFGDVIGGEYPGMPAALDPPPMPIDTRVFYCNDYRYYVYDVRFAIEGQRGSAFLSWHVAEMLLHKHGFLYARTLIRTTAKMILAGLKANVNCALPLAFQSTIAPELGLADVANNYAAGYVVVPADTNASSMLAFTCILGPFVAAKRSVKRHRRWKREMGHFAALNSRLRATRGENEAENANETLAKSIIASANGRISPEARLAIESNCLSFIQSKLL